MFINSNSDTFLGYAGWAAGSFSPTSYELTLTPFETTSGNSTLFTDQEILTKCIVGTRTGSGIATKKQRRRYIMH
jgi:endoglucanase